MFRYELCYKSTLKNSIENDNDPIYNLLFTLNDVKEISNNLKGDENDFFLFLYFNKNKFHQILYDENELYSIDENINKNYSTLFYIALLLVDVPETINYTFSFDFIKLINENFKGIKSRNKIKGIMIAKIILILIHNFKGEDEYDDSKYGERIAQIKEENEMYIKNEIEYFNSKVDLNYTNENIIGNNIDFIYNEIISNLIRNKKFNDYNLCSDIMKQLELANINITNVIFKGLFEALNQEKEYQINNLEDFENETTINFYNILLKYIFKDSFYIYQIDFLYDNIKNFIDLLKNDYRNVKKFIMNLKHKRLIKEIIEILSKNSFFPYPLKYLNETTTAENENPNNKKVIKESNDIIQNIKVNKIFTDIIDYKLAEKILEKVKITMQIIPGQRGYNPIIKYKEILFGEKQEKLEIKDNYDDNILKIYGNYDPIIESDISTDTSNSKNDFKLVYKNYKKLAAFFKDLIAYIKESKIKFNPQIVLELKREEKDNSNYLGTTHNDYKDLYYISCTSTFINQINNNEKLEFLDTNILVYSLNGKMPGLAYLINELTNDDYNGEKFKYEDDDYDEIYKKEKANNISEEKIYDNNNFEIKTNKNDIIFS